MGIFHLFIFPGHKYLGPGNKSDSGQPVDTDDFIAREHDRAYECANCEEDIYRADEIGIFSFILDWIKNKNWHSGVGALGLGFKHVTEKLIGRVIYPRLSKPNEIKY